MKKILVVVLATIMIPLIWMNATPGHFQYDDSNGCACNVAYATTLPQASCNQSRPIQCDKGNLKNKLLSLFSWFDFNK